MNRKAVIALVSYSVLIGGILVSQVGAAGESIFSWILKCVFRQDEL